MLAKNRYFDHAPVLEFFRHRRNALSHGEPRRPAVSRSFVLTGAEQGMNVLFGNISTGDIMDLFDDTADHLRSLQ